MNSTSPGAVAPSRTHPAVIVAAIAITVFALVGVAALTGYLPLAKSFSTPVNVASPAQQQATVPADTLLQPEPAKIETPKAPEPVIAMAQPAPPPASSSQQGPSTPNYSDPAPLPAVATSTPAPLPPPAPKICRNCGTVREVTPIEKKGEGSGAGAVLGGIVGGVLGHQVGSGRGRDVATVAGALGGAYAGNQVEKNKNTVVSWEVRVRLEDGTNQVMRYASEPGFRVGDRVRVEDGRLMARY
jgi:outer membrane lipoprotein SlyB